MVTKNKFINAIKWVVKILERDKYKLLVRNEANTKLFIKKINYRNYKMAKKILEGNTNVRCIKIGRLETLKTCRLMLWSMPISYDVQLCIRYNFFLYAVACFGSVLKPIKFLLLDLENKWMTAITDMKVLSTIPIGEKGIGASAFFWYFQKTSTASVKVNYGLKFFMHKFMWQHWKAIPISPLWIFIFRIILFIFYMYILKNRRQ